MDKGAKKFLAKKARRIPKNAAVSVYLWYEQLSDGDTEHLGNRFQFNVGDKAFSAFDALHGVFLDLQTGKLQAVGEHAL